MRERRVSRRKCLAIFTLPATSLGTITFKNTANSSAKRDVKEITFRAIFDVTRSHKVGILEIILKDDDLYEYNLEAAEADM